MSPKATIGRPPSLSKVIDHDAAGNPITVGERIIDLLDAGNYIEAAAPAAGVDKVTVYNWMRTGARAAQLHHDPNNHERLSEHEKRCMAFVNAVARSIGTAEARDVARLAQLAKGGIAQVVTTVKVDGSGVEIERTTRTEHTLPSERVLMWRMERRFPDRWGRIRVEHTGADGGPIEVVGPMERLRAELERIASAHADFDESSTPDARALGPGSNGHHPPDEG